MRYALSMKVIAFNPAEGVQLPKNKGVSEGGFHERIINTQKTLNIDQIYKEYRSGCFGLH